MAECGQEMCRNWAGLGCVCTVLDVPPDLVEDGDQLDLIRRQLDDMPDGALERTFADMASRAQEVTLGCTCTPTTGRQDDCPVHANGGS